MTARKSRPPRRTRAGNVGQRADGRYLVAARVESRCEVCGHPIGKGDPLVRDTFGQWVHDGCCP